MFEIEKVSGIGEFKKERFFDIHVNTKNPNLEEYVYLTPNEKVFLVERKNTLEVRCDRNLSKILKEEFESVMTSRYFGVGGVEIVLSGQVEEDKIEDLVRLSYNLTKEMVD